MPEKVRIAGSKSSCLLKLLLMVCALSSMFRILYSTVRTPNRTNDNLPFGPEFLSSIRILHAPESCTSDARFVIMVHTAFFNTERRNLIRRTWAKEYYATMEKDYRVKVVFLLGTAANNDEEENTLAIHKSVEEEIRENNDIAQFDFLDTYKNLTYKHLLGIKWVNDNCPNADHLVKVDDDVLANIPRITEITEEIDIATLGFYCYVVHKPKPIRDPKSKWYISAEEYNATTFPRYCLGFSYIIANTWLSKIIEATRKQPFFWVDDAYVTGILAEEQQVPRSNFQTRHNPLVLNRAKDLGTSDLGGKGFVLLKFSSDFIATWNKVWDRLQK